MKIKLMLILFIFIILCVCVFGIEEKEYYILHKDLIKYNYEMNNKCKYINNEFSNLMKLREDVILENDRIIKLKKYSNLIEEIDKKENTMLEINDEMSKIVFLKKLRAIVILENSDISNKDYKILLQNLNEEINEYIIEKSNYLYFDLERDIEYFYIISILYYFIKDYDTSSHIMGKLIQILPKYYLFYKNKNILFYKIDLIYYYLFCKYLKNDKLGNYKILTKEITRISIFYPKMYKYWSNRENYEKLIKEIEKREEIR